MNFYFSVAWIVALGSLLYQIIDGHPKENYDKLIKREPWRDKRVSTIILIYFVEIVVAVIMGIIWPLGVPIIITVAHKRHSNRVS